MNKDAVKQLINDSAELVEASTDLEKHAAAVEVKNAQLLKQATDANTKVAELNKKAESFSAAVREGATKAADAMIARGFNMDKQAFIDRLVANPLEVFPVIEKIASQASAQQLGSGDAASEASSDPIVRFATGA